MALTNYERIGKMMEQLQSGLLPFIQRELEAEYGGQWLKQAAYSLRDDFNPADPHFDVHALLLVMWDQWNSVFRNTLGHAERSLVSELRTVRNDWAHQKNFTSDDAYRALDSAVRLLTAVSAPEAREVERQKQELLRQRFEEQARHERRKAAVAPIESRPTAGLQPWRELVTPHPDVASGRYQQAEFAADLWQVYLNEGSDEYKDPVEFFNRTFLTDGLFQLLAGALRRLNGLGSNPVVELQTNFGGGKTHSMLALYHLFSGARVANLAGVDGVVEEAGATPPERARRVVLVGNKISPGQPNRKADGLIVNTLWGELAWQLGGREGYEMIREADETATNPGDQLRVLLQRYAPALILIDEWVAYARQLHERADLVGGDFDTHFTFAQTLTEAAKAVPNVLLVVSLPASDIEVGGERGREALTRLKNAIGRVESPWRPASAEEGFEIVRRRLFQPMADPRLFAARDAVVGEFARLYREQSQEFPGAAREADYERRMRAAYPIHPELFDRLYNDWSSLERFQRTRGVLRLMATVIHALWERQDRSLLILPSSVPIDDPAVHRELTQYTEDHWAPIIERDVDGATSLPLVLDRENPNLGRYSACRRVARTIYMGSAPTFHTKNPGLDERSIKLGCVQPGESVATFGDALRRLTDRATHLYLDRNRYWFSTQPSVTRLAQDRAAQFDSVEVWEELKRRLRASHQRVEQRGDFAAIHALPDSIGDVPDEMAVRLVILGPHFPHIRKGVISAAQQQAQLILQNRGNAPRLYQNMLVFLAADHARLPELEQALRSYLAWKSIHEEADILDLSMFQRNQASVKHSDASKTVDARILESYVWLLVPGQSDPRDPSTLAFEEKRLQGQEPPAIQASRKLRNDALLYTEFGGRLLDMELNKYNLWGAGDHLPVKQLWEYFARYPYLSRLKDERVLREAIQNGIGQLDWESFFAYAAGYDHERNRYVGLRAGERAEVQLDAQSVLVRPQAARAQLDLEEAERQRSQSARFAPVADRAPGQVIRDPQPDLSPTQEREKLSPASVQRTDHFSGSVALNPLRVASDASQIAEAIIQHLAALPGAQVTVRLEIQAALPAGVTDAVKRIVSENAATLKFRHAEFESRGDGE
jgi:predicted AAA+ superfamily ATPase